MVSKRAAGEGNAEFTTNVVSTSDVNPKGIEQGFDSCKRIFGAVDSSQGQCSTMKKKKGLQLATLHHINDHQNKTMVAERQETPCFIIHALSFFIHVVCHVLPLALTRSKLLSLAWLDENCQKKADNHEKKAYDVNVILMLFYPFQHKLPAPKVHLLSCNVVSRRHCPLVLVFVGLSNHWGSIPWIWRSMFSTLNAFEGVIAIHGDEDAEEKLGFFSELVGASRTGMTKPPAWIITLESNLDPLIHTEENREVDVKENRELLVEIWVGGNAVEITERLDK